MKNVKTRIMAFLLMISIAASLAACSSSKNKSAPPGPLTDWYNSDARTELEKLTQSFFSSMLDFYIEIKEPDTLIYNYRYKSEVDSKTAAPLIREQLDMQRNVLIADTQNLNTQYGLSVTLLRINYFNPDGSEVGSWECDIPD